MRNIFELFILSSFALLSGVTVHSLEANETGRYLISVDRTSSQQLMSLRQWFQVNREIQDGDRLILSVSMGARELDFFRVKLPMATIEPDPKRYLLSQQPSLGAAKLSTWGREVIGLDGISEDQIENQKLCIIDSGYSPLHHALYDELVSFTPHPNLQYDPMNDLCNHGTHVAGIVAAREQPNGMRGVVSKGKLPLHIVQVFGESCRWIYASDLMDAVQDCRAAGSTVVNMSLGGIHTSKIERDFYEKLLNENILLVAAAGNRGNTDKSYPASYPAVMSVAAIDERLNRASFSQRNKEVEISAPGVAVWSTVSGLTEVVVRSDAVEFSNLEAMTGSAYGQAHAVLVDGGRCLRTQRSWNSKIVLCERGGSTFWEKLLNVQRSGALGVLVYNHEEGPFRGTLGAGNFSDIPILSMSREQGKILKDQHLGRFIELSYFYDSTMGGFEAWDGTSMAAPHVAGVAALVWSHAPHRSAKDLRKALCQGAKSLEDDFTGCGLVQARKALEVLVELD
ncbi:MAG: peptidase S8 [Bradymonadales bacterium]|nr:MAG: peptidase S8 [Bradymonadales bacterium]